MLTYLCFADNCVIDRSKSSMSSQILRWIHERSRSELKSEAGLPHYTVASLLSSILTCNYALYSFYVKWKYFNFWALFLNIKLHLCLYTWRHRRSNWYKHHRKHEYLKYTHAYFCATFTITQLNKKTLLIPQGIFALLWAGNWDTENMSSTYSDRDWTLLGAE